ncbi:hypothetical protein CHS0354_021952 [Potamilus streckersoni]|uniref:RING-type domain-containing protein n=1 Tax=Potamilus streckersoni TaxID=2493646 RepID=A0AAE0SKT8_9BIVA|nr:hypothetical protein CHS0354_021952 [Potamilus streckersoni]
MAEQRRENERHGGLLELVKCPICLNILKDPKFLPKCQHMFCASCLNGVLNSIPSTDRDKTTFACPVCRQTNIAPTDANLLPSLRLAVNMIEELNRFAEASDNVVDILNSCHNQVKTIERRIVHDTETIQTCLAVEDLTEDERHELLQLQEEIVCSHKSCQSLFFAMTASSRATQLPSNNGNDSPESSNRSVVTRNEERKIQEYKNKTEDLVKRQIESRHRLEMIISNTGMSFHDNVDLVGEPVQMSSLTNNTSNGSRSRQVLSQSNRASVASEHEPTVQSLEAQFLNLSTGTRPLQPSLIQMQMTPSPFQGIPRNQQPVVLPVREQTIQSQRVMEVQDTGNEEDIHPELMNQIRDQQPLNIRNRGSHSTHEESRSHELISNREETISLVERQPIYSGCFSAKISSDKNRCDIVGIAVFPDATVVVADKGNKNLKAFNGNHTIISSINLKTYAGDVSNIGENQLAVTLPVCFQIMKLSLASGRLEIIGTINLQNQCWGITSNGQTLYVTCGSSTDAQVQIIDCNGSLHRSIQLKDHYMDTPYYIAVSRDGNHVYISDPGRDNSKVVCLGLDGQVNIKYEYRDSALRSASGVTLDAQNNVLVCAANSSNIHLVSNDGTKVRHFIDGDRLIGRPKAICFNSDYNKVYVSFNNDEEIRYFSIN